MLSSIFTRMQSSLRRLQKFIQSLQLLNNFVFHPSPMWRSFSKLKMIKTRLRSSLGQDLFESYMLMSTEVDLLNSIEIDDILSALCKESAEMKNLLSC